MVHLVLLVNLVHLIHLAHLVHLAHMFHLEQLVHMVNLDSFAVSVFMDVLVVLTNTETAAATPPTVMQIFQRASDQ